MRSSLIAWMARAEPSVRAPGDVPSAGNPPPPANPPAARLTSAFLDISRHAHHRIHLAPGCPYIEVNQLLKATGACDSGGAGKMLVAEGHVSVGGVVEHRKTAKIRAGQIVDIGDLRIVVRDGDGERWRRQRRRRRGLTPPLPPIEPDPP